MPFLGSQPVGTSPKVLISNTAPSEAVNGDMWWNSELGQLKIYYVDEDGSQWVDAGASNVGEEVTLSFPFYKSNLVLNNISLISNVLLPFFKSDGTQTNISVTS